MTQTTNIAEEIAELCFRLAPGGSEPGWQHLSATFEVEPWSVEFYKIIHAIVARLAELQQIVDSSDMRQRTAEAAKQHIQAIADAFNQNGLLQRWDGHGGRSVAKEHADPILSLSASLREIDYERPSADEAEEILSDARSLLEWLERQQLEENDFIRQCIITGVREFIFRVEKLEWFGWEHSVASLRDVVAAYLILQRGNLPTDEYPITATLGKRLIGGLGKALKIISGARNVTDDVKFVMEAYGAIVRFGAPTATYIAGYLTH